MATAPGQDRQELLAAREGDEDAARRLVARHGPSMLRAAWSVLGRSGGIEAEDVVQDALIAAWTTDALPEGDVGAWLRAIAIRKALDAGRRRTRRAEAPLPDAADPAGGVEAPSPELDDVLAVREALATLSPSDRAVLTLVDLEGRSMADAAEALGSTRVAVKLRAVRARHKLARVLRARRG